MSYVYQNYASKKDFKAAVAAGVVHRTYDPSGMFLPPRNGRDVVEGPHYPKPHSWYANVEVKNGIVIKVIS